MKVFCISFFLTAFSIFASAQTVQYAPPAYFLPDSEATVQTWVNESAAAIIQISTMENVDLTAFYNGFNREQLISEGLELISEDVRIVDNVVQHFCLKCKYSVSTQHEGQVSEFERVIYFTQVPGLLVMAVASYPLISDGLLYKAVFDSFKSIQ